MFNSGIIDVAIGIATVFILVSTICSAIREGLEAWLKTRAAYLEYAIRELLHDRTGEKFAKHFFAHPLINGLYQGDYKPRTSSKPQMWPPARALPSYIPAKSFAQTVIDIVARGETLTAALDAAPITFDSLRASVVKLPNAGVKRALMSALDAAQGDLDKVAVNLAAWYDGAMDRVSGWYKRSTQTLLFIIALAVVGFMNVNVITIADSLYRNQALRDATVNAAKSESSALDYDAALTAFDSLRLPIGWEAGWGSPRSAQDKQRTREKLEAQLDRVTEALAGLRGVELQHAQAKQRALQRTLSQLEGTSVWNDMLAPLLGLLITAFAATLGAPFWFDVLNKVMVIRATVKPHEKSPEVGSEDRQPEAPNVPAGPVVQLVLPTQALAHGAGLHALHAAGHPENDVDGCGLGVEHATPDDALPPARGGVN
jgi:hypothetical protein